MRRDLSGLRLEYVSRGLREEDLQRDPLKQFESWFQQALELDISMANAMVLATADAEGRPSARYVLLKEYDEQGFVFYTNSMSLKGRQIKDNPLAALVFYWSDLHRQVRIEGGVEQLPDDKADRYFASRPRGSQISAWVGVQSDVIADRRHMQDKVAELEKRFHDQPVPRPESWTGYRVCPQLIEFWQGQENRLHDRIAYRRNGKGVWTISRLAP
jgi:pyridoxamine 5'-phosphate oxidase